MPTTQATIISVLIAVSGVSRPSTGLADEDAAVPDEGARSVSLVTPPGTMELDMLVGGAVAYVSPKGGASQASANLIVRPAGGYFLTRCLSLRLGLLYMADLAQDASDTHQLSPVVGLRWLFRPGRQLRPYLEALGGAGVRFLGGDAEMGYGANFNVGCLVAFSQRVAAQLGASVRLRWFQDPDVFALLIPFGNIGASTFFRF